MDAKEVAGRNAATSNPILLPLMPPDGGPRKGLGRCAAEAVNLDDERRTLDYATPQPPPRLNHHALLFLIVTVLAVLVLFAL